MNTRDNTTHDNIGSIAQTHWEAKWITAEGTFDPAYERTTAALRRWVDGMEEALVKRASVSRRYATAR